METPSYAGWSYIQKQINNQISIYTYICIYIYACIRLYMSFSVFEASVPVGFWVALSEGVCSGCGSFQVIGACVYTRTSTEDYGPAIGLHQVCMVLDQVAGNNRPLYPKVDYYWLKVVHNYEPLVSKVLQWAYSRVDAISGGYVAIL